MKILHVISGDLWAGAEVQVFQLCRQLVKDGNEVSAIVLNPGRLADELTNSDVTVWQLNEAMSSAWSIFTSIRKILIEHEFDVIHSHRYKENILTAIADFGLKKHSILRTQHGSSEFSYTWKRPDKKIISMLDIAIGRYRTNKIVAVSLSLVNELSSDFSSDKVVLIDNGVDVDEITSKSPSNTNKLAAQQFNIGVIGRLTQVKRHDLMINAFRIIQQRIDRNAHLHFFGAGPLEINLKQYAADNTPNNITFHGHTNNIIESMYALDLLVMPSDHEGLPMTLLEAMATKCPIVAHNIGGISTLLKDDCGILVDQHSPEGYAEAVIQAINSPAELIKMKERAFEKVSKDYSIYKVSERYSQLYRSVINET